MNDEEIQPLVMVIALIVVGILSAIFVFYRSEATIYVKDKWWNSETAVTYDTYETQCTTEKKETRCRTVHKEHTRCRTSDSGKEIPVTYPEPGCAVWWGDDIEHSASYVVLYVQNDKQDTTYFPGKLWDSLERNKSYHVQMNILGHITRLID